MSVRPHIYIQWLIWKTAIARAGATRQRSLFWAWAARPAVFARISSGLFTFLLRKLRPNVTAFEAKVGMKGDLVSL